MNLRNKPIRITIGGESKVYDSIQDASRDTGITKMSLYNWMNDKTKPKIDIKVEPLSRYEKLLKAALNTENEEQ